MKMPAGTAMVMKQAALGPAAIAARADRMRIARSGAGARLVGGGIGVDTTGAARLIAQGAGGPMMLKGLGDVAPLRQVGSTVVGAGGRVAAVSIASYAGAGAWAGPIGLVAGAVIGLLAGKLLNKNYLNVNQLNTNEDAQVAAFNQYRTIAGQIPGRQLGLPVMEAIWEGANYSGLFKLNNKRQCYHNGCSKYPGDPSWISGAIHGGAGTGAFSFPYAFQQMQRDAATRSPPTIAQSTMRPMPVFRAGGGPAIRMAGFGALGNPDTMDPPPPTPEAVILIDQYFIPNNRSDSPAWAIPANGLEHQLLYDVADAWLAQQPVATTPYIANPSTLSPSVPGAVTQADPTQGGTGPSTPPPGQIIAPGAVGPGPGGTGAGAAYDLVPVTNPATGQTSYQLNPNNPNAVRPAIKTAGLANIPNSVWLVLLAGMALAVPLYSKESKS